MYVISNIEPFETEHDAEVAADKLGSDYEIYSISDEFDEDDLDEDEEEDFDKDLDEEDEED